MLQQKSFSLYQTTQFWMVGWLVVSGFNATLTAKVISWWSVMHIYVSWLSHTSTIFFPKQGSRCRSPLSQNATKI